MWLGQAPSTYIRDGGLGGWGRTLGTRWTLLRRNAAHRG